MAGKRILKRMLQVGIVVRDLEKSIRNYESFGIGPWKVLSLDASNMRNMTVHNEYKDFAMRVAFAKIGEIQWELIEPADDESIYNEFLEEHGEGLHHVALDVDNFHDTITFFQSKGIGVLQAGDAEDLGFAYLDTGKALGCITEIYNRKK